MLQSSTYLEDGWIITNSDITQTDLVDNSTQLPVPFFAEALQSKFADIVASVMSDPVLFSHVEVTVPCTRTQTVLVWRYEPFWLFLSYSLSSLATVAAVVTGLWTMKKNGYAFSATFSTFFSIRGDSQLMERAGDNWLAHPPLAKEFRKTRVKYGIINQERGELGLGFAEYVGDRDGEP